MLKNLEKKYKIKVCGEKKALHGILREDLSLTDFALTGLGFIYTDSRDLGTI